MDLALYARLYVATYGKNPPELDAILATHGTTRAAFDEARRAIDARAQTDSKVAAEVNARVILASANLLSRPVLPPPTAVRHVRARKCPRCGGYKRTAPRTAYIYCDYCGMFFDYDEDFARQADGIDQPAFFRGLVDGTRAEIARAFNANDDAAYLRAWHWPYEMEMELRPANWSPRIGDPIYRKAMIEFCAGTCLVNNRDERKREAAERCAVAHEAAMSVPNDQTFLAYLASVHDKLVAEIQAYERARLFAIHPDKLDPTSYLRINLVLHVLDWRSTLSSEAAFTRLLQLARVPTERVEVDPVQIHQASCGQCSGQLLVVQGAQHLVCEACGHTLACNRAYPCPSCGAHLLASPSKTNAGCAWCGTIINVVV